MSNVTSEFMDYDGAKTVMEELKGIFEEYSAKLDEIDKKMATDINAGDDSALDTSSLGTRVVESWEELASDFAKFKNTFTVIYNGVAQSSTSNEALENVAAALLTYSGESGESDSTTTQ